MPPPDLLATIRAAAHDLTPAELASPILVGVSGGPDSLTLLHLLWRWRAAGGPALVALHVDHRLRPESAAEAQQVGAWCTARDIPFVACTMVSERVPTANIEQIAREGRYRCFAEEAARVGARVLALAHHADDQAETLLLHLLRGSGLAGLAGMPAVRRAGDLLDTLTERTRPAVWRPLLAVRRATILAYCADHALAPLHDPSNDDTTLRRNAIRHLLLPEMERHFPGAGAILSRDATLIAADEAYLQQETVAALARVAQLAPGLCLLDRAAFAREPLALQRRLLRAAWTTICGVTTTVGLDADVLEAARNAILGGKTGAQQHLPGDLLLLLDRAEVALGPCATLAARLRERLGLPLVEPGWRHPVAIPSTVPLGRGWSIALTPDQPATAAAPVLHIPEGVAENTPDLLLRTWRPGDRTMPLSGHSGRKLQDWFTDHHIPSYVRHHLALLARGNRILWIVGLAAFIPPVDLATGAGEGGTIRLLYNGTAIEPVKQPR